MEVGIRKRAWHMCIRYTLLIYDHWGEYTLSKKNRRLVYGVYPPNTPLTTSISAWFPPRTQRQYIHLFLQGAGARQDRLTDYKNVRRNSPNVRHSMRPKKKYGSCPI